MSGVIEGTKRVGMVALGTIAFALGSISLVVGSAKIWASARQTTSAVGTVIALKKLEIQQHDFTVIEKNCPVIRFQTTQGKVVEHLDETVCYSSYVGKKIEVVYDARNPRSVSIANGTRFLVMGGWGVIVFVGCCLGLFGVGALWNGLLGSIQPESD